MSYHIRTAHPADVPAIRDCAEAAYQPYVAAIGKKPAPMVADFAGLVASGLVYVAQAEAGEIVGFIVFYQEDDHILLENVAIRPANAGQGIGRALITFCEAQARRARIGAVKLYTNAKMEANLTLYPHLGYRQVDRRTEDGFDRVYFEKVL